MSHAVIMFTHAVNKIVSELVLTGTFTHAIHLHERHVETHEEIERFPHDRRCRGDVQPTPLEAEGGTYLSEHQPVGQRPPEGNRTSNGKTNAPVKFHKNVTDNIRNSLQKNVHR